VSGFLLDTNIPSELIRSHSDPRVASWVYAQNEQSLYLSVISIGELRRGFVLLPASKRRIELEQWFENDLIPRFQGRILPITQMIADRWGVLDAHRQMKGIPLRTADGLIGATALEHSLTVVTRNAKDFVGLGVKIFNPWDDAE
jgi:predicted nucleic acid-binding protein